MIFNVNKYNYRVNTPQGYGKILWVEYSVKENLNRVYVELDVNKTLCCFEEPLIEIIVKETRYK